MALSEFQKAFKAARASGEKEFEFEGKKYNTKYKEEAESSVKKAGPEVKKSGTPDLPVTKVESSNDSADGKPFRPKNLTDLIGLSSNIRKPAAEPTSKEDSKQAPENKSWWTTPNKNLQEGKFPTGKEIRAALGSSYKKGGSVRSSASSRADGIAQRGKTKGRIC